MDWMVWGLIPGRMKGFFFSPKCLDEPYIRWVPGALSLWAKQLGPKPDHSHLHLVPKLRMNGTVPLLPLHAFIMWMGTVAPVPS